MLYLRRLIFLLSVPWMAMAGEIVIVDAPSAPVNYLAPVGTLPFPVRSERESDKHIDRARKQSGRLNLSDPVHLLTSTDERLTTRELAEEQSLRAQQYSRPSPTGHFVEDPTIIILRNGSPLTDAEKARNKARAYGVPEKPTNRGCGTSANQVGTIGDGETAKKSADTVEKGGSSVSVGCK